MEQELASFIQDLLRSADLPARKVALPCEDWSWLDQGLRTEILGIASADYAERLNQCMLACEASTVYHYTDLFQCNYTCARLPECGESLIIGPFLYEKLNGIRFDELFQSLKLPEALRIPLQNYYCSVSFLPSQTAYESLIVLIADRIYGKKQYRIEHADANTLGERYQFYNNYWRIPDKPFHSVRYIEDRYNAENALLQAVYTGNESEAAEQAGRIHAMLPQRMTNELRDTKDYLITLNTLLRKAAESAGVHPIHIDSLSNGHVKSIERLTSAEQCEQFRYRIIRGYCRLVRDYNLQNYSLPIRKAITYISTDWTADLSLKSIADQLNINASYLSALFRKEVGIPLTEYVNTCRIKHAQLLLQSTDLPIKTIALHCGISDMYYFSRMFKRITGVTPKAYRDNAGKEMWRSWDNVPTQTDA